MGVISDITDNPLEGFWDILSRAGIDDRARIRAERLAQKTGEALPVVIAELGLASDEVVVEALCQTTAYSKTNMTTIPPTPVLGSLVNTDYLRSHRILPLDQSDNELAVAMVDPFDYDAKKALEFACGKTILPSVIALTDWRTAFDKLYGRDEETNEIEVALTGAGWVDDTQRLKDLSNEAPIVRKVDKLFTDAVDRRATDIHVEPAPNLTRIRLRIDGVLQSLPDEAPELAALLASRVKVLCDMDVADRRRPQDGRTSVAVRGRPIDLRVSTVPTVYGESLAIRILDRKASLLDLSTLGFSEHDRNSIETILRMPKGIFLVTGPTGSGKTTTLYAALNRLRQTERKVA